jgi:DNA-binding NtrC family response regulator
MHEGFEVLFVEDDARMRDSLVQTLELAGFTVRAFCSAEAALPHIAEGARQIVITDVRLSGIDGLALLERVQQMDVGMPVVLIGAHGDIALVVRAMRAGAYDFLEKPFCPERLVETATRAMELRRLRAAVGELRQQLCRRSGIEAALLGRSAAMERLRRRILRLADTSADVMILGETGTGKEVVARCLHDHSARRERNFVAVNCGGLPEALFESELFGHESGAFTSAGKRRIGKLEHANGGTLLLDEIESMPMPMQTKLLRVLQERKLERLGSNEEIRLDVRVVAATKCDLKELSDQQKFRADLYYRLNVAVIALPPLRDRREDIPLLFEKFTGDASLRFGAVAPELTGAKLRELLSHDWPGNVREVRNAADRSVLDAGDSVETAAALTLAQQMDQVEKALVEQALRRNAGRMPAVMETLGIAKKTLYDKLRRHGIDATRYR